MVEGPPADLVHEERAAEVGLLGQDPGADLRVPHPPDAFGQRQVGEVVAVGGPVLEGVELRLEAHQHAEAPVADLGAQVRAPGVGLAGRLEPGSPMIDLGPLHHEEGDRAAGALAQPDQPLELVLHGAGRVARDLTAHTRGHDLEHAGTDVVHGAEEGGELVLGSERAGHRFPPGVTVPGGPPGGEPEGTGLEAGTHDRAHLLEVVVGGVVEGPLAHHVGPDGGVRDVGPDVEGEAAGRQRVEVLGEALPPPADPLGQRRAGDVLDSLHQLDQRRLAAGTDRREAHTAVAQHGRGHPVPARRRQVVVPGHLAVVVGVDVDEAGGDHQAVGVDLVPDRTGDPSHLGDRAAGDGDVGRPGGRPGAVDHGAPTDHDVVHVTPPKTKSSRSMSSVTARYQPDVCGSCVTTSPAALWK